MPPRAVSRIGKLKHTSMRIPQLLYDHIAAAASTAGRSVTGEIELRLEMSLEREVLVNAFIDALKKRQEAAQ